MCQTCARARLAVDRADAELIAGFDFKPVRGRGEAVQATQGAAKIGGAHF